MEKLELIDEVKLQFSGESAIHAYENFSQICMLICDSMEQFNSISLESDNTTIVTHKQYDNLKRLFPQLSENILEVESKLVRKLKWTKYKDSGKYYDSGIIQIDWKDVELVPHAEGINKRIINLIHDGLYESVKEGHSYVSLEDLPEYDLDPSYDRCYSKLIMSTNVEV